MSIEGTKGLVGWYDANDSSTIIYLSQWWRAPNLIYQWNNKASKLNNITYYWNGSPGIQNKDGMQYLNFQSNSGYGTGNNTMDFVDSNENILNIYTIFLVANLEHDKPFISAGGLINQQFSWPIVGLNGKTLLQYIEPFTATYYINGVKNNIQQPTINNGNEIYYPFNIIQIDFSSPAYFKNISISQFGIGNIGEILMFENKLSLSNLNNIYSYLKNKWNKTLLQPLYNELCNYTMNNTELKCYQNNYPDLNEMTNTELQNHWNKIGCNQNRNNKCPQYQTTSGLYNYIGCCNNACYTDSEEDNSLINNRGYVTSIDYCQQIAENNNETIFGLKNNGNCWTGNNLLQSKKYGQNFNKNNCSPLGGNCTQQLYLRSKVFTPPPPPIPKLTNPDFSNSNLIDSFENYSKYYTYQK